MEWTIQDLGAIGEFVGALGVIITLVYLAYQIRQNTVQLEQNIVAARAGALGSSSLAVRENRRSIYESGEMSEIYLRGNSDPQGLSELELHRYRMAMQNITESMFDIYNQTAVTNYSPETWATQGAALVKRVLGTPGGRWF